MDVIIEKRIAAIREALDREGLDALMVSVQENRHYLSGYTGEDTQFDESAGVLIISKKHLVLATDSRFELQAQTEAPGFDVVRYEKGLDTELTDVIENLGIRRLGFESVRLSHKSHTNCVRALENARPPVTFIPTENIVESLRQIKSEDEIQRTIKALRLAENAFKKVLDRIRPQMTERQVAWYMEREMREAGAQGLSFPVIVASGPNSALPHAIPTDRPLNVGEPILIDWGARLDAFCSDTTRTFVLGKADDPFRNVFDTVVQARDMAIAAIKAGASGTQMDRIARDHIDQKGYAGKFGHSLGHGTGLAVHEAPRLSPVRDDRLEAGMIVTVEPGIYLPGWGGIRMENQVVVRENEAQVLNANDHFNPIVEI